ncbi:D-alanyl-D-alanine carboxypeptidase family protein [Mangrovicella endophytica]|uniref:D-alanyl-D-alanine carboxypeptidase family protein n=1 Tax=Mangrovicella endophytica TaxID=2066697 RepID=UPI001FE207A4|nr:D-alanyl-D-alanine carboxypeptidase family protein [Mangrovicella endophytica]
MKAIGRFVLMLLPALAAASAASLPAGAETSVVVDVATGKVLSEHNATQRWYPASTTKLMTAYVALRAVQLQKASLDTPVIMTRRAAAEAPSKMGFQPGSVIRLDVALRMMLVKSANDVAYAIGQTLGGGSMETFVGMMNAEAARLGMRDSHFVNPNGLPGEGQYSSAKDLAILGTAIRRDFRAFSDLFGTEAISAGKSLIINGNKLLGRFDGADGMKTGYICASGFNLVSSATRNGRTLVAVVLGADGPIVRERTSAELLENGFKTDPATRPMRIEQLPVSAGAPADISNEICSAKGRGERAEERAEEAKRKETFGSPYMHDMDRPPAVVKVALGGAAGNEHVEPGVTLIAAYGIPIPTFRPTGPADIAGTPPPALEAKPEVGSLEGEPGEGDMPVAATTTTSGKSARLTQAPVDDHPAMPAKGLPVPQAAVRTN